jgi:hypothetical protein
MPGNGSKATGATPVSRAAISEWSKPAGADIPSSGRDTAEQ